MNKEWGFKNWTNYRKRKKERKNRIIQLVYILLYLYNLRNPLPKLKGTCCYGLEPHSILLNLWMYKNISLIETEPGRRKNQEVDPNPLKI